MRLRTARKIWHAIGGPREGCYTAQQKDAALSRMERTASSKQNHRFWDALMRSLGPAGRAKMFVRWGRPAEALGILMRSEPEEWEGDPTALEELL